MDFFDRQEASHRTTRYLILLFGLAFLAVGLATGVALVVVLGISGQPDAVGTITGNPEVLAGIVAAVVGIMAIASLFRIASLSRGGGHVARMMGGTEVHVDDNDPLHRRLINVVEEMAIASGVPVPEIYVLEQESGINAFAAGLSTADAAVAVTRGSLENLNRAELQGVIAHEFSHILNGDMRLNLRLMGFSFGILVLSLVGRSVLRASGRGMRIRTRRGKGSAAPIVIGLALFVIGSIGVLLSRLIKAAVSRQREVLADASAVQFTREPMALAGALKKIGGYTPYIEHAETEEVSHMLFGRAGRSFTGLFATHPPLDKRIQALDPSFVAGDYITVDTRAPADAAEDAAGISQLSAGTGEVEISVDKVGNIEPEAGSLLHAAIPADLGDAAHSAQSAWLLVLALGLERGGGTEAEKRLLENQLGAERAAKCVRLAMQIAELEPALRLPLFELAAPALKARPMEQIDYLFELLERLAECDGEVSLFEYLLIRMLKAHFYPAESARASSRERLNAMQQLIAAIAVAGHSDPGKAQAAFSAGLSALHKAEPDESTQIFASALAASDFDALDSALDALAHAPAGEQRRALTALAVTMRHDAKVTRAEAEIFRTIAATLGCPVPPMGVLR